MLASFLSREFETGPQKQIAPCGEWMRGLGLVLQMECLLGELLQLTFARQRSREASTSRALWSCCDSKVTHGAHCPACEDECAGNCCCEPVTDPPSASGVRNDVDSGASVTMQRKAASCVCANVHDWLVRKKQSILNMSNNSPGAKRISSNRQVRSSALQQFAPH
jgi:hypothetical protein